MHFSCFQLSVTNGGKTTLYVSLTVVIKAALKILLFFLLQPESEVETDERGFKLYDGQSTLMHSQQLRCVTEEPQNTCDNLKNTDVYILIKIFLTLPYEECKRRRSTRVYQPADTPGYFDGHVWPMYLKHKIWVFFYLDGTKSQEELLSSVYSDIIQEFKKLREESK
uniref:Uncharacterized protein n=1 Tax=Melopsittacus undulatus TaxID=13146 RepID=A0A8V5GAV2_MELUD